MVSFALGSRVIFDHWSDGSTQATRTLDLEDDTNLTPVYVTQYQLTLTDPAATGSGWHNQGSVAEISIPPTDPIAASKSLKLIFRDLVLLDRRVKRGLLTLRS